MVMGGILVAMYALNLIASLKENWEELKYLSFFHYFDYGAALIDKVIAWESLVVFVGVIFVSVIAGAIVFLKRDIAI